MKIKRIWVALLTIAFTFSLTGCSGSEDSSGTNVIDDISNIFSDSANVLTVKDAYIQACSTATLGEMADAFMSNPQWRDFEGTSGNTIVELTGEISYDGLPAEALIQFEISGGSFEAIYLGINNVDQNKLILSTLLNKMCDAA